MAPHNLPSRGACCTLIRLHLASYFSVLVYEHTGEPRTSMRLDEAAQLNDSDAFDRKGRPEPYADICASHFDVCDIFELARWSETEIFNRSQASSPRVIGTA